MACATSDERCSARQPCATHRILHSQRAQARANASQRPHNGVDGIETDWAWSEEKQKLKSNQERKAIANQCRSDPWKTMELKIEKTNSEQKSDEKNTHWNELRDDALRRRTGGFRASDVGESSTCCLLVRDILAPIRMLSTLTGTNKSLLMDLIVIFTPFSLVLPLM